MKNNDLMELSDKFPLAFPHPTKFLKMTVLNYGFTAGKKLIEKYVVKTVGWEVGLGQQ